MHKKVVLASIILLLGLSNARAEDAAPPLGLLLMEGERALIESRYEDALSVYQRAVQWYPQQREVHSGLGLAYLGQGRHRQALEHLMPLVTTGPRDFVARNNAAWIYATTEDAELRDPPRAVRLAQEAMLLAPDNHNVYSTLAAAHHAAGNRERALRAIEQALRLASAANVPPHELQVYQARRQQYQQALQEQETP